MRLARSLTIALALSALAFAAGCGDDDNPADPGDENQAPPRSTVDELLTEYFPYAYQTQDTALYKAMLDEDFEFEFLADDLDLVKDILGNSTSWGKNLDVGSTRAMFGSAAVTDVTLNIRASSSTPYLENDCLGCTIVEATITLRVITDQEGSDEPLILAVDSPQEFVVKPPATGSSDFSLWRQVDRPRQQPLLASEPGATESKSWGEIKGLYRSSSPEAGSARATENTSWGAVKGLYR